MAVATSKCLRLIDIGANLTDPMFQGIYRGKQAHQSDFEDVLKRAFDIGLQKIIITGGSLSDSKEAVKVASTNDQLFSTVGCHPTRCGEFEHTPDTTPQQYLDQLLKLAKENKGKVAAIGECGLDFDRLHFCPKELQLKYFEEQLLLSEKTGLPIFLHCRNAFSNFIDILQRNKCKINGGVMHSFDGTREEALTATDFGLYIGINGCSLKTEENLKVVRALPVERILIETEAIEFIAEEGPRTETFYAVESTSSLVITARENNPGYEATPTSDAPWCEIRPTHASATFVATQFLSKKKERWEEGIGVKGRNEPRNIIQVLEVVASLHNMDKIDLSEQIYRNTCNLFSWTT